MKKIFLALAALMLALGLAVVGTTPANAAPHERVKNVTCSNQVLTGTYKNVTVAKNSSCTLDGATVLGNVKANNVYDVKVLDTEVSHNIHVMRSIGDVVIGNRGCKLDPHAGNNIMVKKSHNVAICWETVDNNIQVTGNDGRISLFHNVAGNNIKVMNNRKYTTYDTDTSKHHHPGTIRVRHNKYDNHLMIKHNAGRPVIEKDNKKV